MFSEKDIMDFLGLGADKYNVYTESTRSGNVSIKKEDTP